MQIQKIEVKLNFISPVLGSLPADPAILTKFIAANAPSPWQQTEEEDAAKDRDQEFDGDRGLTVFAHDENGMYFYDYHIKGFIKEAGNTLKETVKVKNLRSKIDNYLFIQPRRIYLLRPDGSPIHEENDVFERPLRAQTMKGPRVSLVASERINLPVSCQFTIEILENEKDVSWKIVQRLLEYGRYKGLGQWRNGGWGRFLWEQVGEAESEMDKATA